MILGLEIGMLIAGILALIKGKFTLTKNRVVEGAMARVIGLVMVLPIPLAIAAGVMVGFALTLQGKPIEEKELRTTLAIVEVVIVLACLLLAVILSLIANHSAAQKRAAADGAYDELDRGEVPPAFRDQSLDALPADERHQVVQLPPQRPALPQRHAYEEH
jgi:hypothetical protein